jgi:hypothetical protein
VCSVCVMSLVCVRCERGYDYSGPLPEGIE